MRADRLLSLLMLLETRGRMTADRLAAELEVSIRTIYRDIYALRVAGFPVDSERGLGGGCYLHENYRVHLTDLTQDELMALFTMAVPAPLVDLGVGQEAKGALLKLAAALPAARRNVEQSVRNRFHLDPKSWHSTSDPMPILALLREGVWTDRWMDVTFQRIRNIHTTRTIAPYGLVAKATRWYVVWRGQDDQMHVDYASVIVQAMLRDEHFERPENFDLPAYWSQWAAKAEARRPSFLVSARVKADVIPSLTTELGRDRVQQVSGMARDGRVHVSLDFEHFAQARSRLLGLGAAVEVVAPEALRLSIADFASQVTRIYLDS
jgi:predicted DNA-binding transcriptional regulator YafY